MHDVAYDDLFTLTINVVGGSIQIILTDCDLGKGWGFCPGVPVDFRDMFNPGNYLLFRDTPGCTLQCEQATYSYHSDSI